MDSWTRLRDKTERQSTINIYVVCVCLCVKKALAVTNHALWIYLNPLLAELCVCLTAFNWVKIRRGGFFFNPPRRISSFSLFPTVIN